MTRSYSRRQFLIAGGGVAAGVATIAIGRHLGDNTSSSSNTSNGDTSPDDLAEAPRIDASNATLTVATDPIVVAGRKVLQPVTYNGLACGPTLVMRPGMVVNLALVNRIVATQGGRPLSAASIAQQSSRQAVRGAHRTRNGKHLHGMATSPHDGALTNLHFHGMHVPQTGEGDNPFLRVAAGASQHYGFQLPAAHAAGLFWYHPHATGLVTNQLGRGAAGLISIENAFTDRIAALGIRRRLMQLHQLYFDKDLTTSIPDDDNKSDTTDTVTLTLINGQLHPRVHMRPGEPQVWAMANTSTTAFYLLSLQGHVFDVIAEDGIPLIAPRTRQQQILIAPAKRLEVIVRAAAIAGRYDVALQRYDQGADVWPAKSLATVIVTADRWTGSDFVGVDTSHTLQDLRSVPAVKREVHFGEDPNVPDDAYGAFLIDGRPFDPNRVDFTPSLGSVEEWTIVNDTSEDHPFHMHTNQFQLTSVNGSPVAFAGYQDTNIVPRLGSITMRVRFADFPGRTLAHCHIVDHECNGMMALLDIE